MINYYFRHFYHNDKLFLRTTFQQHQGVNNNNTVGQGPTRQHTIEGKRKKKNNKKTSVPKKVWVQWDGTPTTHADKQTDFFFFFFFFPFVLCFMVGWDGMDGRETQRLFGRDWVTHNTLCTQTKRKRKRREEKGDNSHVHTSK